MKNKVLSIFFVMILLSINISSNQGIELSGRILDDSNSLNNLDELSDGYYIIDMGEYPVSSETSERLNKIIKDIEGYIPRSSLIVKADSNQLIKLKEEGIAKRIWHYTSEFNYDPRIKEYENLRLFVSLFDSSNLDDVKAKLIGKGEIIYSDEYGIILDTSEELTSISNAEGVEFVEQYADAKPTNGVTNVVSGSFDFRNNWGLYGENQIIALADSGIDTGTNNPSMHDDFEGRIQAIVNLAGQVLTGPCPMFCSTTSADLMGHGTHVAGSALGNGKMSGSNPGLHQYYGSYAGSAPEAKLVFVDLASDDPLSTYFYPGNLLTQYFPSGYNNGARIMSGSWAYFDPFLDGAYNFGSKQTDQFTYNNPEMLPIFAAGNYGPNTVRPPSTAKNAISVGSNDKLNINTLASFSSTGPTRDGRIKPDIMAPGSYTTSTKSSLPSATYCVTVPPVPPNPSYAVCSGTSMSTPVIAGLAAVAREFYDKYYGITNPSAALIKATLLNGAENMGQNYNFPNFNTGWGRANISSSFPINKNVYFINNGQVFTGSGQSYSFNLNIKPGSKIKATLVWTDKEGSITTPPASPRLVNDLDLVVKDSQGVVYYGNDFKPPYNDADRLNNVEQVRIENAIGGKYIFTINAFNIPLGSNAPQSFSIFVTYECGNGHNGPLNRC